MEYGEEQNRVKVTCCHVNTQTKTHTNTGTNTDTNTKTNKADEHADGQTDGHKEERRQTETSTEMNKETSELTGGRWNRQTDTEFFVNVVACIIMNARAYQAYLSPCSSNG